MKLICAMAASGCFLFCVLWHNTGFNPPLAGSSGNRFQSDGRTRWRRLYLTLHLESGEQLKCLLDTGCAISELGQVFRAKTGKVSRLKNGSACGAACNRSCIHGAPALFRGHPIANRPIKLKPKTWGRAGACWAWIAWQHSVSNWISPRIKSGSLIPTVWQPKTWARHIPFPFPRHYVTINEDFMGVNKRSMDD